MRVVDETDSDLRSMIEADFDGLGSDYAFPQKLVDWLHFKARQIPVRPRQVAMSDQVRVKQGQYTAIGRIVENLVSGANMEPWLSGSVQRLKEHPKADLLFNDWKITHFHIGNVFVARNKVRRTRNLLFAYITDQRAVLLDIQPHGTWTMQSMLEILLEVSPSDMEKSELMGVLPPDSALTADEIYEMRQAGMTAPVVIAGRVFSPPGLGISTSGHSVRLTNYAADLLNFGSNTTEKISNNQLPVALMRAISVNLGQPVRLGLRMDKGQFVLYDKNRNMDLYSMPVLQ